MAPKKDAKKNDPKAQSKAAKASSGGGKQKKKKWSKGKNKEKVCGQRETAGLWRAGSRAAQEGRAPGEGPHKLWPRASCTPCPPRSASPLVPAVAGEQCHPVRQDEPREDAGGGAKVQDDHHLHPQRPPAHQLLAGPPHAGLPGGASASTRLLRRHSWPRLAVQRRRAGVAGHNPRPRVVPTAAECATCTTAADSMSPPHVSRVTGEGPRARGCAARKAGTRRGPHRLRCPPRQSADALWLPLLLRRSSTRAQPTPKCALGR
jgi:hypothetical protein